MYIYRPIVFKHCPIFIFNYRPNITIDVFEMSGKHPFFKLKFIEVVSIFTMPAVGLPSLQNLRSFILNPS